MSSHVRSWPLADISVCTAHVRSRGHDRLLMAAFSVAIAKPTSLVTAQISASDPKLSLTEGPTLGWGHPVARTRRGPGQEDWPSRTCIKVKNPKAPYPQTNSFYLPGPTRLTPPFALPPALCRTAARATGRGLSTTPALATQPCG